MRRPGQRPMRALPILERQRTALENCVFCPKLCRDACPASNAEPRETITPWGKMSMTYFVARGDVPLDFELAAPTWACTECHACRGACDHRNDVASTLRDARAALADRGVLPKGARTTIARFAVHEEHTRQAVRELMAHPVARSGSPTKLLVGCTYARAAMPEARHAIEAAAALSERPVTLLEACCGLPLLYAGARDAFAEQARKLAREARGASTLFVADAGCAMALRRHYPEVGVEVEPPAELLVERAVRELDRLGPVPEPLASEPVRYHDPCQLGRGLGLFDPPRAVLARALGRAPEEFTTHRERATCSGAGGLLPRTRPDTSRAMTDVRLEEHDRAGGGRIVTACGASLLALRRRARRGVRVDDLSTWIARAAGATAQNG